MDYRNNIEIIDDYTSPISNIKYYTFEDIIFRTNIEYDIYKLFFITPIALYHNKIPNIINKVLYCLPHIYNHSLSEEYNNLLNLTYNDMLNDTEYEYVEEDLFYFTDYEGCGSTGHTYDCLFYLLYFYKKFNLTCKLLVIKVDNKYYNNLLKLIKDYFNVEYFYVSINKNYKFKRLHCIRNYQNLLFFPVKDFINEHLIKKVIEKFDKLNLETHDNLIKIKIIEKYASNITNSSLELNNNYINYCNKYNLFDLNKVESEELKIYLLNKSKNIILSFGSIFMINILYYLLNSNNKRISVIYTTNYMTSRNMFTTNVDNTFNLKLNNSPNSFHEISLYNTFSFQGEIIDNVKDIDDFINRSSLL